MTIDLEPMINKTLENHAGDAVDPAPLLRHAVSRGRRIRRRRAAVGSAVLAVVVGGVAAVVPMLSGAGELPAAARVQIAPPPSDAPGAVQRPDLVGTDPGTLHFTADALTAEADYVSWSSYPDHESLGVSGQGFEVWLNVTRSPSVLDKDLPGDGGAKRVTAPVPTFVGSRPGALREELPLDDMGLEPKFQLSRERFLRWQPVDGMWAQVRGQGTVDVVKIAEGIRFDKAMRCVVPLRLTALPADAKLRGCAMRNVSFDHAADIDLAIGQRRMRIRALLDVPLPWPAWAPPPHRVVLPTGGGPITTVPDPHPARPSYGWDPKQGQPLQAGPYTAYRTGQGLWVMVGPLAIEVTPWDAKADAQERGPSEIMDQFSEHEALTVIAGMVPAPQLERPDTW